MAVFRVEKNRNYTVMSNYHLRDTRLTLKAVGLLSKMLSLTDEWEYSTRGLAAICKEGVDAIGAALKELENCGYLVRHQLRDDKGRISDTEYVIYETPHTACPDTENPDMDNPDTDEPDTEKPAQLSKEIRNTKKTNTNGLNTDSIPFCSANTAQAPEATRRETTSQTEYQNYRDLIRENIEYDILCERQPLDTEALDEIVELMTEVVCAKRKYTRVAGSDFPHEAVKSRFLKLDSQHIEFVLACMKDNTTKVKNIKQYLLAVLFNAPVTINSYYSALVNHDLYGGAKTSV